MAGSTTRQLAGKRRQNTKFNQRTQLQPGDMLQNRYRIMGTLGVGGFSSVYQARDMRFSSVTRLCAVKEMINVGGDPQARELAQRSFETEASILATMEHVAVPEVYDYFSEDNRSYLVMEYIRGKDLEGTMDDRNEPIDPKEAVDWALQVCDVLIYLHSHKPKPIVFRDLKPSNIMLDQQGRVRLIDFGIAKVFQGGAKGTMIGTEGYSPPEQYRGEASPAGDVYALGATLHHLLTLRDPRMEPPFSWQERHIPDFNPKVSSALNTVVMRCLSYKVSDRYENAMELSKALQAAMGGTKTLSGMFVPEGEKTTPPSAPTAPAQTQQAAAPPPAAVHTQPSQAAAPAESADSLPHTQGMGIQPLWKFKCEDEIRSKPDIADKYVYIGAYDNNLYALNKDTGEFQWKYPATDGIASAPSAYKNDVFIGSADYNLYCINRITGKLKWRFATEGAVYSSPRAAYDYVFFGSDDGHLYAVNIKNGKALWKAQAHSAVRSTPLLTDEYVYFGTEGGYVYAFDLRGQMKWQFQAKRGIISSPTVAEDMVFVGSMDSTVYALDANSGWAIWRARTSRPIISSPVVDNDVLYIGSSDGKVYALDIFSGRQIWNFETAGQVASSPAVWEDHVYFGSTDGYVYSISTRKGRQNWRYRTGGYVISSPIIDNGVMYIGSCDHHVYAFPT